MLPFSPAVCFIHRRLGRIFAMLYEFNNNNNSMYYLSLV